MSQSPRRSRKRPSLWRRFKLTPIFIVAAAVGGGVVGFNMWRSSSDAAPSVETGAKKTAPHGDRMARPTPTWPDPNLPTTWTYPLPAPRPLDTQTTSVPPLHTDAKTIPASDIRNVCNAAWVDPAKFAAFAVVIDAQGRERELVSVGADVLRHPASITKMMSLLIAFSEVEAGRLSLNDRVTFSAHARSVQKVNLAPQLKSLRTDTLPVRLVMLAMGVRSANDAAVALAEKIAGSEAKFVQMMNLKARSIGMTSTVFKNASGLPDSEQVTTARDLVKLERYIHTHYSKYKKYLSTRSFTMGTKRNPQPIHTHNRLLLGTLGGRWTPDFGKTGYVEASGSNTAITAFRAVAKGKRETLYAVVMGGTSGTNRDNCMQRIASRPLSPI